MTIEINKKVFYTTAEFAALMRYADERPVRSGINAGKIPHITRPDGRFLIPAWHIENILRRAGGRDGHQ